MNIGCDIDNCIVDFNKVFVQKAEEYLGKKLPDFDFKKDCTVYSYEELIPEHETQAAIWDYIYSTHDLFVDMPLLNQEHWDSFLPIQYLEDINVYFITNRVQRPGRTVLNQTVEFFRNIGWEVPQVIVTPNKAPIIKSMDIKIMLDDAPQNLIEIKNLNPDCEVYAFDYAYNRNLPPCLDIKRVDSLDGFHHAVIANYMDNTFSERALAGKL